MLSYCLEKCVEKIQKVKIQKFSLKRLKTEG